MGEVYRSIERVAGREDDTVLIIGETGSGREMIAYAIHLARCVAAARWWRPTLPPSAAIPT